MDTHVLHAVIQGEDQLSVKERETEEMDEKGMRYLRLTIVPIMMTSSGYSLYYYTYKSWWSWLVSSLANGAPGRQGCNIHSFTATSQIKHGILRTPCI